MSTPSKRNELAGAACPKPSSTCFLYPLFQIELVYNRRNKQLFGLTEKHRYNRPKTSVAFEIFLPKRLIVGSRCKLRLANVVFTHARARASCSDS
ncbi:uncharacterized protein PgNI_01290 [Pyricularia grisea]|uniref:Uncharacterized protein n=1 Tax=Pyricularia grisea TaxID=148305 RepID=A0A6P8BGU7_PYRGI|nr:uncharacterized protein PgNI_01290 [Pyricularia grisea]TLD15877.1 hypothetical protein PgNI_01290 [Pyricularia grisea]